jgi:hypothetical protein
MFGLLLVAVFVFGRKALQDGQTPSDRLMDVTAGPCILLAMGIVLLFLVNRRVQDELEPRPNKLPLPTPASVTSAASAPVAPSSSAADH